MSLVLPHLLPDRRLGRQLLRKLQLDLLQLRLHYLYFTVLMHWVRGQLHSQQHWVMLAVVQKPK